MQKMHIYKKDSGTFPFILHFTKDVEDTLAKMLRTLYLPIKQKQYCNLKINIQNKCSLQI